jgi:tropomyosin
LRKKLRSRTGLSASSTRSEFCPSSIVEVRRANVRTAANPLPLFLRLRQTDVKSGHYERKVQALEQSRDQWETKYEEMAAKYAAKEKELNDLAAELNAL